MTSAPERAQCARELDAYYATYPTDLRALERELLEEYARHPEWLPTDAKGYGYAVIARRCPVKVFRHFPFYFEIDVGKARTSLGEGTVGDWMKHTPFGCELEAIGNAWWTPCEAHGLVDAWPVLDDNHHSIGNDNVLRTGLLGLIARTEQRLTTVESAKETAFLTAMIAGLRALITVSERFADEAERLLADETDPLVRSRLRRIADTARRVPAAPPTTFYEAVNTLLFMREVTQALEGNGNSILGHLDRILLPYYTRDLATGQITRDEAKELLEYMLALFDIRFGMRHASWHVGTNTTVIIGGCDAAGAPVFNDITRMIAEIYREQGLVDPKLNARLSATHPPQYVALLAELTAGGCNSLAIFNDDVIIPANVKMGKAVEDCRLYVGGGCQENLLENTEVNSRATIYLNLAQVLLMGFFPDDTAYFRALSGITPARYDDCTTYDALYATFRHNLIAVHDAVVDHRNLTEAEGGRYNPCPLHSATLDDCIVRARDMMEGGARYSFGSISLTGIGTVIDSLYAIREAVFTRRHITLAQLAEMLANDFAGTEALRRELAHRLPKYGQENTAMNAFSAQVFTDLARDTTGKANTRGGHYEASLFSFRSFTSFGNRTGATPDGRRAGAYLSSGMSPSQVALGRECSIGQVLNAIAAVDLTDYPVVAVLDLKLPVAPGGCPPEVMIPVINRFMDCGGSVVQINTVDPALLLEAKTHPERASDLVVRVSGYSAYFITLPEVIQDEVIERALAQP